MKTKSFSELRKQMTPERRAKNETRAQLMLLLLTLAERQKSLGVKQEDIDKDLEAVQFSLSQLESQDDLQVSILSRYIKTLGGNLKLVAQFSDDEIVLAQFE